MKKITLIIIVSLLSILSYSQDNAIDKYYQEYSNSDQFTKINITGKMFELFSYLSVEDPEDQEILDQIRNLSGMKMLICDSLPKGQAHYKSAIAKAPKEYEVLMTVDDPDEDITFYIKETNGTVHELLLIGGGEKSLFIMSLYGVIDLKQISKLASRVKIGGFEHLEHVGE